MLFRKRKNHGGAPPHAVSKSQGNHRKPECYKIDFDMMLKGNIYMRRGVKIRQCGVTVNGSTLLVTSGDIVSQEAYEALINFGAIRPKPIETKDSNEDN